MFHDDLWVQVDLLSDKEVTGVSTQGKRRSRIWVTEYKIEYKENDSDQFKTILDENGAVLVKYFLLISLITFVNFFTNF